jgi:hypothetical protein
MTMVLAIVAGCGGAPRMASAPDRCAGPNTYWVPLPMSVGVEASGRMAEGSEAIVLEIATALRERDELAALRVEGIPGCGGTSTEETAAAAVQVARRFEAVGVPRERLSTIGYGAGRCGLCPCASPAEKGCPEKCSIRCPPDPAGRRGEVRVEFSVRVCL